MRLPPPPPHLKKLRTIIKDDDKCCWFSRRYPAAKLSPYVKILNFTGEKDEYVFDSGSRRSMTLNTQGRVYEVKLRRQRVILVPKNRSSNHFCPLEWKKKTLPFLTSLNSLPKAVFYFKQDHKTLDNLCMSKSLRSDFHTGAKETCPFGENFHHRLSRGASTLSSGLMTAPPTMDSAWLPCCWSCWETPTHRM